MSFNAIKIQVRHDDPLTRAGLVSAFSRYSDMEVVDDKTYSDENGRPCNSFSRLADVVVADFSNVIQSSDGGLRRCPQLDNAKIVIVAATDREWEIRSALECGVRGYVMFNCAFDELASCVRAVNNGLRHLSPNIAQRLAESLSGEPLTVREVEVLSLVVEGFGNKIIARRLDIAVGTVKSHLKGVFEKLRVDSRTQAIREVERRGLLRSVMPAAALRSEVEHLKTGARSVQSSPATLFHENRQSIPV